MTRTICVVTGSRAEYGLLRWVMEGIRESSTLRLQVIVTGMHLSPEFGMTVGEITNDGFTVDRKIETLLSSDTAVGVSKAMGLGLIGFAEALDQMRPDMMLVLGDRFEILAAVSAALVARLPVAHLHGGEVTEGAFDESIRHGITKMSALHFVAAEPYRRRVIQLGEHPDRVFCVGGLGVDSLRHVRLLERTKLESELGFRFLERNLMIAFHPATLDVDAARMHLSELLAALGGLRDTGLIFTLPNADPESRSLIELIEGFVAAHPHARAFKSLGAERFLSCLQVVDGIVGNSSSGLTEMPSFAKGTVNIGDRQKGRLKAESVIDCEPKTQAIAEAIERLFSRSFREAVKNVRNPYGEGGASKAIVRVLEQCRLDSLVTKPFYDLPDREGDVR